MKNRFIDNIRNGYLLFMKSTELETDDSFLVELNSLGILTVKGSRDIYGYEYLTDKLSVVTSCLAKASGKRKVIFAEHEVSVFVCVAIHFCPAVKGVSRTADSVFKVHYRGSG